MPTPPARRRLRLATRGSPLARAQTAWVAAALEGAVPGLEVEEVVVATEGDRRADVALDRIGGQGVFVKEVQAAVLGGGADAAVHSAKDLPSLTPPGLVLAAVPPRADARDALVGGRLHQLPTGAAVATGSARRRAQLANLRPDLTFVALRGNMGTRLARVEGPGVDAVVVAMAALERLGWAGRADDVLSPSCCLPQVGQGALAVECRADDEGVRAWLRTVDDPAAHRAVDAERAMLAALGAGCTAAVGGWARPASGPSPGELTLAGMVAAGDGRMVVRAEAAGGDPGELGNRVARLLEARGAAAVPGWAGLGAVAAPPGAGPP